MKEEMMNLPAVARIVTVTIPASVAYDFEKITKVTKTILGRLGCGACCSGHDIRYKIEDTFHVDEKLNVNSRSGF